MNYKNKSLPNAKEITQCIASDFIYQDGIYISPNIPSKVSYPDGASEVCFSIEDKSFWFHHRNDCIITIIKRFSVSGVILDVGGGNGFVSKMLVDNGLDPILVEPNLQGCINAKGRGIKNIICGCIEDLDFSKTRVDTVGLFDVLEHVENESYFFSLINCLLSDCGKLLISVPSHSWLWSADDEYAGHHRRYSIKSLNAILSKSGFKILFYSYFWGCLLIPILFFRRLPYLLGRKKVNLIKKRDYIIENDIIQSVLSLFSRAEINKLRKKYISNGASILALAEKV